MDVIASHELLRWCYDIKRALARPGQTLVDHTVGVVDRIFTLTELWELSDEVKTLASLAGVFHDVGKLQCAFQEALSGGERPPAHGPISACLPLLLMVEEFFGQDELSNISPYLKGENLPVLWIAVYSHHGYMRDVLGKKSWLRDFVKVDGKKMPIVDDISKGGCKYLELSVVVRFIDEVLVRVRDSMPWLGGIRDIFIRWMDVMDGVEIDKKEKFWKKRILPALQRSMLDLIPNPFVLMDVMTVLKTADRYDATAEEFPEERVISGEILGDIEYRIAEYLGRG